VLGGAWRLPYLTSWLAADTCWGILTGIMSCLLTGLVLTSVLLPSCCVGYVNFTSSLNGLGTLAGQAIAVTLPLNDAFDAGLVRVASIAQSTLSRLI
jgi:hypothetical protein